MKVLLVNPAYRRPVRSILPRGIELERGLFPPLGILYLASSARSARGVEVSLIDAQAERLSPQEIGKRAGEGGYDLAGVTVMSFTLLDALDAARAVKAALPDAKLIAGGPHPHLFPEETLGLGPFDAVMRGEGELSFRALSSGWPGTRDDPPPGVKWKDGASGQPEITEHIEALDSLPFPARDLTRTRLYHSVLSGARPVTTMMSSRGCPYRCVFCDRPHLGKRFRARSAKSVVKEMEECAEMGVREVVFYDDTFTADPQRVRETAELIIKSGLAMAWDIRARVSDLDQDDYRLIKRAGCQRVHFGVESGDPEILRSLRKGITIEQAKEAFKRAREAGLETLAYFMAGLPGETRDTLDKTLRLAIELDPDYAHFSVLIPFPGTPIYATALERGVIGRDVWEEFAADPGPGFKPPVWEENLSEREIVSALARMYRKFYGRPRVILRRLRKARTMSALARGGRMGSRILFMRGHGHG